MGDFLGSLGRARVVGVGPRMTTGPTTPVGRLQELGWVRTGTIPALLAERDLKEPWMPLGSTPAATAVEELGWGREVITGHLTTSLAGRSIVGWMMTGLPFGRCEGVPLMVVGPTFSLPGAFKREAGLGTTDDLASGRFA